MGCGGAETAAVAERPTGTLVFVSGSNRLTAIDVATGRRTVRRVSALAACGPELYMSGGRVIFGGLRRGRTIVYSAPVTLDRPPTRLGAAHAFVRSATHGRVWLAGVDCDRRRMVGVREVTVEGETRFSTSRRVPGGWVAGAVEEGLVVQRGRALLVWDPRTGTTVRRLDLGALTDARGSVLAGCAEYSRCDELAILDARTAAKVVARPSDGYRLELGGRLSPDGSTLAVGAVDERRWSVALVDARTGASAIVPGTSTGEYPEVSWAASGWLFIRGQNGRVLAYRPGAPRAIRLPLRLPKRATAFVAG